MNSAEQLAALMAALRAAPPLSVKPALAPRPEPAPDEPFEDWLRAVQSDRSHANSHAMKHRAIVDDLARDLFGYSIQELLPVPDDFTLTSVNVPTLDIGALRAIAPDAPPPLEPRVPAAMVPEAIPVSIIAPPEPRGTIICLHGGAYWMGGDVTESASMTFLSFLAHATGCAVWNVDYRLAPEHPYPASIVDALAVLDAVRGSAQSSPDDPIFLLGISSGANAAIAATIADMRRGQTLAGLVLLVPSAALAQLPAATKQIPGVEDLRALLLRGYLGSAADPKNPWFSPSLWDALPDFPPTFLALARHDEIAVGGAEFAEVITKSGGSAVARTYEMTHTIAPPDVEAEQIRDITDFIVSTLEP